MNTTRFAFHTQLIGSVTHVTDAAQTVVESYLYDPYGKPTIKDKNGGTVSASQIGNAYLFTGRQLDEETGLYYYRARHYSPELRRFIQRDPLEYVDGPNAFAYVRASPTSRIDPEGLFTCKPAKCSGTASFNGLITYKRSHKAGKEVAWANSKERQDKIDELTAEADRKALRRCRRQGPQCKCATGTPAVKVTIRWVVPKPVPSTPVPVVVDPDGNKWDPTNYEIGQSFADEYSVTVMVRISVHVRGKCTGGDGKERRKRGAGTSKQEALEASTALGGSAIGDEWFVGSSREHATDRERETFHANGRSPE